MMLKLRLALVATFCLLLVAIPVLAQVIGTNYYAPVPVGACVYYASSLTARSANGLWNLGCDANGNLKVTLGGTSAVSGVVSVSNFPATQPVSGTVTANAGSGTFAVSLAALPSLAAGTALIGSTGSTSTPNIGQLSDGTTPTQKAAVSAGGALKVDGSGATQPVSGAFWQATQPVSIASMPSTPVTGTFWQATQPVSIASMPSTPVTCTSANCVVQGVRQGTSVSYNDTWPDRQITQTSITSATTTKLITGAANQYTFIFYVGFQNTGTNSANTFQLEWGTTVSTPCDTTPATLTPQGIPNQGTGSGLVNILYGNSGASSNAGASMAPTGTPLIIPTGYDLCLVTTGTTTAGKPFGLYSQHT